MSEHPKTWAAALAHDFDESAVAVSCGALVVGRKPSGVEPGRIELISRLGAPGRYFVEREQQGTPEPDYWPRVWGARGLLYVWDDAVEPDVVAGLDDPHWRVREMCAKVAALRELGSAADALTDLLADEVPRVRAAAVRALGQIAEREQLDAVRDALDDPVRAVVAAAERALGVIAVRLDLPERP